MWPAVRAANQPGRSWMAENIFGSENDRINEQCSVRKGSVAVGLSLAPIQLELEVRDDTPTAIAIWFPRTIMARRKGNLDKLLRAFSAVLTEAKNEKQTGKTDQQGGSNVTKTVSTTIRSNNRYLVRNDYYRALCARCLRGGQIEDWFLGPLGPGSE